MTHPIRPFILIFSALALLCGGDAIAADDIKAYTPPPLFGAPEETHKVRPEKPLIVKPAVSPVVDYQTAPPPPDTRPLIVEKKSAPRTLNASKEPASTDGTRKSVTSSGVVKGPVEMPAAPASAVETLPVESPTAAGAEPTGKTMLEAHQERVTQQTEVKPPVLTSADLADIGPLALSVPFQAGTTDLSTEQKKMLESKILPAMTGGTALRLQILSFATSTDESQSGDRRIALNRALAIRTALLAKGVPAERMDVRALGDQSDKSPRDRVDLILTR